jgi:hypothetical protein
MLTTQQLLQFTILFVLGVGALVLLTALLGGYLSAQALAFALGKLWPVVLALGVSYWALVQTEVLANDPHGAARLNSTALSASSGLLTVWAWRINRRHGALGRGAWTLVVATGVLTVIESVNLMLWNASEPIVWGVVWFEALFIIQVALLVLAAARQHGLGLGRVQPSGATGHPNGAPDPYPDAGCYRPRVTPGIAHRPQHPHPSGHRRPVAHPTARPDANTRRERRITDPTR